MAKSQLIQWGAEYPWRELTQVAVAMVAAVVQGRMEEPTSWLEGMWTSCVCVCVGVYVCVCVGVCVCGGGVMLCREPSKNDSRC